MNFNIILLFAAIHGFTQAKIMNLSCNQVRAFVDGHNSRRLQLAKGQVPGQPPATGMKFMVWDDELAAKAAKWASKNHFAHNPDRSIGSRRFNTGENLYWYATTSRNYKINIESCLKSWFDEYNHYTYGPLTRKHFDGSSKHQIGHYTQPNVDGAEKKPEATFELTQALIMILISNRVMSLASELTVSLMLSEAVSYEHLQHLKTGGGVASIRLWITEMAWANTMYVGCAISQYGSNNMKEFLVVCNYGPGGNYLGQKPYERSKGSSSLICGINDCRSRYGDKCRN